MKILNKGMFILPLVFAISASLTVFWLVESSIKYSLFLFELTLILSIFYILTRDKKVKIDLRLGKAKFCVVNCVDLFIIFCILLLIIFNLLGLVGNYIATALGIIAGLFAPGWALLRIFNAEISNFGIEALVLPFILSIPVTSLVLSIFLMLQLAHKLLILIVYLAFSILPLIKTMQSKKTMPNQTALLHTSLIGLIWLAAFFSFVILSLYPNMAYVPGLDIVRHFSSVKQIILATTAYNGAELWFHMHLSFVYLVSEAQISIFQTSIAFLSIFSLLSFYMMSKTYLTELDSRLPSIATVFWSVFSGFGWLYFLGKKLLNPDSSSYYKLLSDTSNASYWDVGYGQGWIWLWYRPLTLGLTLLFTLLSFLKYHELNKKVYILLFSTTLLTLNFVHFPESVIFVLFIFALSLLRPKYALRLKEATISLNIAMPASFFITQIYQKFGISLTAPSNQVLIILIAISLFSTFLAHFDKRPKISVKALIRGLPLLFALLYIWLLIVWLITADQFSVGYVSSVYGVPWQFYPLLLGLSGLLAIFSTVILSKRYSKQPITIFAFLLVYVIIFGRVITYFNLNIAESGYWERRFVPIAYAAASLLAPMTIAELTIPARMKQINFLALFLSFLVILGISSTFLTLEFQTYSTGKNALKGEDLDCIKTLNELPADKVLLTLTDRSRRIAEFSPSSWLINYYRYQLWPATHPELPLNVLYSMGKPVYLFLTQTDMDEINKRYGAGYLANHFITDQSLKCSYTNATIIPLPHMTPPSPESLTVLVLPKNEDANTWYAYDILSLGNCHYTTGLIDDLATISKAKTIIAPTEDIALQLIHYKQLFNFSFSNLIVFNLDGYGKLSLNYFPHQQMNLCLNEESKTLADLLSEDFLGSNITSITAPTEFEIQSKYVSGNIFVLLNENTEEWITSGIGSGSIDVPKLNLDNENKAIGNASIRIEVGAGKFAYWQIAKNYPQPLNVDDFDFISFYWFGRADNKNYVLQFHTGPGNNFWYYFKDTWQGWRKVLIPMHVPDGSYSINGVNFVKVTNGNPTWSNIIKIEIRNEGSNPNLAGTFYIDNFCFESALSIGINISTKVPVEAFKIYNFDGENWNKILELATNTSIQVSDFILTSGLNAQTLFGKRTSLSAIMMEKQDKAEVTISIRLPPNIGNAAFCSVKLKVIPITPKIKVTEIVGQKDTVFLSNETEVDILSTDKYVTSWYSSRFGRVPFSILDDSNKECKMIYVNMYPLIMNANALNYDVLGNILSITSIENVIQKIGINAENPVQGNLATFQNATFEGDITIESNSSIIIEGINDTVELTFDSNRIPNISKIIIFSEKIKVKMSNGFLSGGSGFYSLVYANSLRACSNISSIGTVLLSFDNGTLKVIDIPFSEAKIIGQMYFLVRQPTIYMKEDAIFSKIYTYAALYKAMGILGYNAEFHGRLSFNVVYGDTFTVVNNFYHYGSIISDYKKYNYNEFSPLIQTFPILILICLLWAIKLFYPNEIQD